MTWIKAVCHIHTHYSDDGNASPAEVIENARVSGVQCLAVTDHDTIEGACELAAAAGPELKVIVGEEISTADGHLIGLFLSEQIEPGLSARKTAELIHSQGGLVVVPHPFNRIFHCSLGGKVFDLLDHIDVVEVFNAQNLSPLPDLRAERFAREYGFPAIVGADMHHRGYLDGCYQWLEPFDSPDEFLSSLKQASFVKGRYPLGYFARSAYVILRSAMGWGTPPGYGQKASCRRRELRNKAALLPDQ